MLEKPFAVDFARRNMILGHRQKMSGENRFGPGFKAVLLLAFIQAAVIRAEESGSTRALHFPDKRLTLSGLPWFSKDKPLLCRLPARLKDSFRKELWDLALQPSGGRIRFRTDSQKLTLKAECADWYVMYHITSIGENGFDVYVDGLYRGSTDPIGPDRKVVGSWDLGSPGVEKEVTLYMPLYKGVRIDEIGLDEKASVKPPGSFSLAGPVVFYGTSITQGGCASNPGMSYPAILSRRLKVDFVNLGFSGNGHGDESVARAMTEIKASAFVLDYWANVDADQFEKTLPPFVDILRRSYPQTPILVTGPYYTVKGFDEKMRKVAEDFVAARRGAGDKNIAFVDGLQMINRETTYALVDGLHCNTLGFQLMADALETPLREALHLGARAPLSK
jgi:hypothetical protein